MVVIVNLQVLKHRQAVVGRLQTNDKHTEVINTFQNDQFLKKKEKIYIKFQFSYMRKFTKSHDILHLK